MSERLKCEFFPLALSLYFFSDAKNGICRIENFAECLANRRFPTESHWMIGNAEWWSRLKISIDRTEIFLDTWCNSRFKRSIRTYSRLLNNLNEDEKRFEKTTSEIIHSFNHSVGFSIPILEILDLKNGWLDNGTLFFEYGFQVDAVMRFNFWEFNFYDKLFNEGAEMIQFSRKYRGCLYAHCQLLEHQSQIHENTVTVRGGHDELCFFPLVLQIAHGVQFKLECKELNELYFSYSSMILVIDLYRVTGSIPV
ncbi:hypothetical protein CAEBREN_25577 [Caenorhabditis brenneri]|uniref:Uncharacterized protein n=1 Tax=Caenorhabditis brenneri TaxID=135651 RepID=G0NIT7_CAEBE|nr:hypothetical protein CAEBREN_25577 [Caenorhabditis brenneri]